MMRGAFVGGGKFEQPPVIPHPSQQRYSNWIPAADESGGHGHLWQSGRGAFFARARLRTVTFEAASMESIGEKSDVSVAEQPAAVLPVCCPYALPEE